MPGKAQSAERVSVLRRSASAYLHSPSSAYLTGSSLGIAVAILLLLALGGV
jgi:hypothetical protein